jgi:hypothetical protein
MSTITIPLPEEDLAFLRAYSAARGMSAETLLAKQAHSLRTHLEASPHPEVAAATGILAPGLDADSTYRDHLEDKHR